MRARHAAFFAFSRRLRCLRDATMLAARYDYDFLRYARYLRYDFAASVTVLLAEATPLLCFFARLMALFYYCHAPLRR